MTTTVRGADRVRTFFPRALGARRSWLTALLWLALFAQSLWAPRARAQLEPEVTSIESPLRAALPADVMRTGAHVKLPELPGGFVEKRIGSVQWAYHESDAEIARELQVKLGASWRKVVTELGRDVSSDMTIRIARGPDDMRQLAPVGSPPPAYAVGVAYPSLGLVILSVVSPDSWFPPDIAAVMTHELSHIALYRAVQGHALPLWFVEGLATTQAGEHRLARVRTLWEAAVAGEVLPLDLVSSSFPTRPQSVNLAYAQSADLVRHLLQSSADRSRLSQLLGHVAEGMGFEQAVLSAYRIDLDYLEREWHQGLSERFRVLPLVLTGTALWGGIAVLVVVAFLRRRKQHHEKLARWAAEEAESDRVALAAVAEAQAQALTNGRESEHESALDDRHEPRVISVYALPPPAHESGVPTVEHEGQRHTLH
ncbi:MAG: hypothetical protein JWN04_3522 [Myxococcaceae bacterium]|nr:hypothetical protein [Myxococcaceae bacterium]